MGAALVLSCEPVEGENVDVSGGSVTVSVSEISVPEGGLVERLVVEAGKVSSKSYTVAIDKSWDASNLEAIIYTLRPFPATPVQAVTRAKYTDKAGAYVDNVVSVKAGKSVTYEFE